jgi:hypothetical protein
VRSDAPASDARPTVRQIYALAAVLCEKTGELFPQDRGEASALLDRLKGKAPGGEAAKHGRDRRDVTVEG